MSAESFFDQANASSKYAKTATMSQNNEVMRMALRALEVAVIQSAHDMALTGEESRQCGAAIVALRATIAAQGQSKQKPYAYAVYFPDQPTEMLAHELDDLCDDMTNREHSITELFSHPAQAEQSEPVAWVLFRQDEDGLEPVMFYGGKEKPSGEFKDRFTLRPVSVGLGTGPAVRQIEPVAHQYQAEDGTWHHFIDHKHRIATMADGRWPVRALYTAPAVRQPLTKHEIHLALDDAGIKPSGISFDHEMKVARAIEAKINEGRT